MSEETHAGEWVCPVTGWWEFGNGEPRWAGDGPEPDWPFLPPGTKVVEVSYIEVTWEDPSYQGRLRRGESD